ncbi:MAG: SH3 domain-containing protein [Lentisphaerae bacterium]|nr:SH3 domain-containing protein [Lentisphaerota bacterium]
MIRPGRNAQAAAPCLMEFPDRPGRCICNLRAKPSLTVEVVAQVSEPDILTVKSVAEEWVEVLPPDHADLWVLGDYVQDGMIRCNRSVNVRAGAGINFNVVGQLADGDPVEVRGSHADWIRIAPPSAASLWVAASLVELVLPTPPEPEPEPVVQEEPPTEPVVVAEPPPPPPQPVAPPVIAPPADLDLNHAMPQGELRDYEGTLRPRSFFARTPSRYRLTGVRPETGSEFTICYVRGNDAQLKSLLNRRMRITGREYWVFRLDYPVLIPERIVMR